MKTKRHEKTKCEWSYRPKKISCGVGNSAEGSGAAWEGALASVPGAAAFGVEGVATGSEAGGLASQVNVADSAQLPALNGQKQNPKERKSSNIWCFHVFVETLKQKTP